MGDDDDEDKKNPKDGKKKVRVKGNKKAGPVNDQEEVKEDKVEKVEESKEKKQEASIISNKETSHEIRLEELLSELTLNDKPEETSPEDDKYVEEFISKLEKIKIEK